MPLASELVCPIAWEAMTPVGDRRRFCGSCRKVVYDLADCGADEVEALARAHGGSICGRYRPELLRAAAVAASVLLGGRALADGSTPALPPCDPADLTAPAPEAPPQTPPETPALPDGGDATAPAPAPIPLRGKIAYVPPAPAAPPAAQLSGDNHAQALLHDAR